MTESTTGQGQMKFITKGTGGIPNLRIVWDHASSPPTLFFELHTQIALNPDDLPDLLNAINSGDFARLADVVVARGVIHNDVPKAKLHALLKQLYKVP